MPSRRNETMTPASQPVRFYKFVALTFLFITIILSGVIMFMSSKRTTIIIETRASPVDISDSILVGDTDKFGSLKGVVTSVDVNLNKSFVPTESEKHDAEATGTVTLYNDSELSQPLIPTTRLLTSDGILFRLKDRVVIPAKGTIEADVYADEEGESGDIGPAEFTIPGLSEAKQKEIYAVSESPMTGGVRSVGILGASDMEKAEEAIVLALEQEGTKLLQKENPGLKGVFKLINSEFNSNKDVGDEVFEFTLTGKAKVLGVFYKEADLQDIAEKALSRKAVDDTEIVQPSNDVPTVVIEDYNLSKETATLQLFYSGISKLNPESAQLEKNMFFGKTKDEVRRYLLKLDHVRSVDIKFTPAWIRTVPSVGEHIEIIVKEVQ
ncbi:MAG: hypothetical protein Q8O88_02915 [bacterium]|nr:hypothetical protein [bacterium]